MISHISKTWYLFAYQHISRNSYTYMSMCCFQTQRISSINCSCIKGFFWITLFGEAGKALRAGARANKIVRVFVRVMKYTRLLKVFRFSPKANMRLKAVAAKVVEDDAKVDDVPEKSRVGAALTDLMNQRYAAKCLFFV